MTAFITKLLAGVSEQMLIDLFQAIVREIVLNRKKSDITHLAANLKAVVDEVANTELTDDEKNARLVVAGRSVIDRLRQP